MNDASPVVSECPSCGRRYVPTRHYCVACTFVETVPSAIRSTATVLSRSTLHRVGGSALVTAPVTVLLVREDGEGATFCAPLDGHAQDIPIGASVKLVQKSWTTDDGGEFAGIVAHAADVSAAAASRIA